MKKDQSNFNKITLGVCYYPEHWDESLWTDDLVRMEKAGISVIRIAEFAWNKFEPEEGAFTFEFFDRFIKAVEKSSIKVIMCTPTATPPAWASHNYPEILNAAKDGTIYRHGHRRHYNYNSPKYIQLTAAIVEQMARHYANHPSIIGWQIDNEINCEMNEFYSNSDSDAFRIFLRKKYGSLDAINKAWGTVFWNQDYSSWEQVFVPRPVITDYGNPHQQLDYLRFISDSACRYTALQCDILRHYLHPNTFITTNGLFGNVDNHRQVEENLDFMTYDSYPNFAFCRGEDPLSATNLNDRKWSAKLSETRSVSPIFGIMEQQSGPNGWVFKMEAPSPKPGQMTLWTMQSVAHGADFISYFRWRTCTVGTEIYWHGILDYDNQDNRRYAELTEISKKINSISELRGAHYKAAFAVVKEYDNVWDAQFDVWHGRADSASAAGWFEAAQVTHTPMDYLYITDKTTVDDLARYPFLVYPHATILTERTTKLLEDYVTGGGKLLMGSRSGYKNEYGHCLMQLKPGPVCKLFGVEVRDFSLVGPADGTVYADWDGQQIEAAIFNDVLTPIGDAQVLARFTSNYYKGQPALIKNSHGKGEAYYFGGAFTRETAVAFLQKLGIASPHIGIISMPEGCELAIREKDSKQYLFVLNFLAQEAEIELKQEMYNLYTGKIEKGKITLTKYETKVYKI